MLYLICLVLCIGIMGFMGFYIICLLLMFCSKEGDDGKVVGWGEDGWEGELICDRDWVGREYIWWEGGKKLDNNKGYREEGVEDSESEGLRCSEWIGFGFWWRWNI